MGMDLVLGCSSVLSFFYQSQLPEEEEKQEEEKRDEEEEEEKKRHYGFITKKHRCGDSRVRKGQPPPRCPTKSHDGPQDPGLLGCSERGGTTWYGFENLLARKCATQEPFLKSPTSPPFCWQEIINEESGTVTGSNRCDWGKIGSGEVGWGREERRQPSRRALGRAGSRGKDAKRDCPCLGCSRKHQGGQQVRSESEQEERQG